VDIFVVVRAGRKGACGRFAIANQAAATALFEERRRSRCIHQRSTSPTSAARGVSTNGPHHQRQPLEVYSPTVHITNVSRSRCIHQRSTSPTSAARGVSTNGPHHQRQPLEVYPPTVHITNVSRSRCIHQRSASPTSAAWGNKSISARRNRTCLRRRSVGGLTAP
jgi:hypothetical protein